MEIKYLILTYVLLFLLISCKSKKRNDLNEKPDIIHVIMYGQSLMLGTKSIPIISDGHLYNTFMFSGGIRSGYDTSESGFYDELVPLVEKESISRYSGAKLGETPASGFAEMFFKLLENENKITYNNVCQKFDSLDFHLLISSPAQGSTTVRELSTGKYWERFQNDVINGYRLAMSLGKTYNVPFVLWNQGETDISRNTTEEDYKESVKSLQIKIDKLVRSVTNQKNPVCIILYQTTSQNARNTLSKFPIIANAQYELARDEEYIKMSNTTYQLNYSPDNVHFSNIGSKWNGFNHAIAAKRILIDGKDWHPIYLKNSRVEKDSVWLFFKVPCPPLVIDTVSVKNPGDFGFNLYHGDGEKIDIKRVLLQDDSSVLIVSNMYIKPTDFLWYGNNGIATGPVVGERGNLRDIQGDKIRGMIQEKEIRLDNWMPIFRVNFYDIKK